MPGLRGGTVARDPGEPPLLTRIIARSAIVPSVAQPSLRSEQVSQLVLGETGRVEERAGEWRRIRVELDGYQGWVHAGYCVETEDEAADRWRAGGGRVEPRRHASGRRADGSRCRSGHGSRWHRPECACPMAGAASCSRAR